MTDEPSQRIEQARKSAGFSSARQAAIALRMSYTTYINYERGYRGIDFPLAERLARTFKVEPFWLLTGKGEPRPKPSGIPVMGKVGAGAAIEPVQDGGWVDAIDRIELPEPEHLAIVITAGDSQMPRYREGEAILYDTRPQLPDDLIGQYAICDMMDGRRLIKIVRRAGTTFWLESHNADPEMDAKILACYRVVGTLMAYASPFVRPGSRPRRR
jgi:transcriptional regulator with XRE-family HTH domain